MKKEKTIKVLHVSYSLNMGGLENVVLNLAGGINRDGFVPSVCVLSDELGLKPRFDELGVPVCSFPKRKGVDWTLAFRLKKYMKENPIDIVHTHNPTALLYGGLAAMLSGKKLVHTEHSNLLQHKKLLLFVESLLFKRTDCLVCDTNDVKKRIHESQGIASDKLKVIFNGVDTAKFSGGSKEEAKNSLGLDPKVFVAGTVARLNPVKDQKTMIAAVRDLKEKDMYIKLLIAGDGKLKMELEDYTSECGLEDMVTFLGERSDVSGILKTFDAFILCSLYEGMSVSLLEAMSSSLPCIVTDVGGNTELIKDGDNGFVVPVNDPQTISRCLEKLMASPDLCRRMGQENKSCVEERYSLERMCTAYQEVYQEVLSDT